MKPETKDAVSDVSVVLGAELLVVAVLFAGLVLNVEAIADAIANWVGVN